MSMKATLLGTAVGFGFTTGLAATAMAEEITVATVNNAGMIPMQKRAPAWEEATGNTINVVVLEKNVLRQAQRRLDHRDCTNPHHGLIQPETTCPGPELRRHRNRRRQCHRPAPAKRSLAMVFQSHVLGPHLSERKTIAFPLRMEFSELQNKLTTTMVSVTHDQVEAMTMADNIVVLHAGAID